MTTDQPLTDQQLDEIVTMPSAEDIDTLVAQVRRLRAQVTAVTALCDKAEKQATRWEQPLPVPEWVGEVRRAVEPAAAGSAAANEDTPAARSTAV